MLPLVSGVSFEFCMVLEATDVSKQIKVYDVFVRQLEPVEHEVGADEAGSVCN